MNLRTSFNVELANYFLPINNWPRKSVADGPLNSAGY